MMSDKKSLLQPISVEQPCGVDLSFSPEFDLIHEARREDDPTIDYGEWQTTLKQADWGEVVTCCTDLLQTRSKDLRLAAWLTEALVKTSGLGGLADGMETMGCLLDRFGGSIHPLTEDGDQEQRIGTLSWYVGRMAQLVREIPLTRTASGDFCLNDYDSAIHLQAKLERHAEQASDAEGKVTVEQFTAAVVRTDRALYGAWIDDASRCGLMLEELEKACDRLFGNDGPSFSPLEKSIDAMRLRLQAIANELGISGEARATEPSASARAHEGSAPATVQPRVHGVIETRAQALEALREVARFFRNTEPHSPVAYLADKAANWGAMPLHAWLQTVVKDHSTLSHIEELLGLDHGKSGSDE
ncbi:type VI secretion system protein TssA [Noviherbaspirillum agri]